MGFTAEGSHKFAVFLRDFCVVFHVFPEILLGVCNVKKRDVACRMGDQG